MESARKGSYLKSLTWIAAPPLGWRYWITLGCASVLGANLGDVLSRELGLGYWRGLPVLAVLFGGVAWGAQSGQRSEVWYWLAIVLVRATATNLSDWQVLEPGEPPAVRSPISFPIVIATWSAALLVLARWDQGTTRDVPRPRTGTRFWATMLVAGTAGTAVGDWLGFQSGLELPGAAALTTLVVGLAYVATAGRAARSAIAFWLIVASIRTWGTNVGDLTADTIGLLQGTTISGGFTAVALCLWRSQLRSHPALDDEVEGIFQPPSA